MYGANLTIRIFVEREASLQLSKQGHVGQLHDTCMKQVSPFSFSSNMKLVGHSPSMMQVSPILLSLSMKLVGHNTCRYHSLRSTRKVRS